MSTSPFPISVGVIIPTRNEALALPRVLGALPDWINTVVVADYASTDGTGSIARAAGAHTINLSKPGYGHACLRAVAAMPDKVDTIVFLDGDASNDTGDLIALLGPIARGDADLVIGSRVTGSRERGALTPQQILGNWLACTLIRWRWGVHYTDLGPFRAITRASFNTLSMRDENFGWTVEMQVKAAKKNLRVQEIPVRYRRRIGTSKISGTISGTIRAGTKILAVIAREALSR
jgi:glycosyltransferase involved in cell wall biosynthesis